MQTFEEWDATAPGGTGGSRRQAGGSRKNLGGEGAAAQGSGVCAAASTSARAESSGDSSNQPRARGAPLKEVVADGVERWFQETLREAQRGDVKQQALLGEMLQEGYGCQPDPKAGREWAEKAQKRGYRMRRVYCEL